MTLKKFKSSVCDRASQHWEPTLILEYCDDYPGLNTLYDLPCNRLYCLKAFHGKLSLVDTFEVNLSINTRTRMSTLVTYAFVVHATLLEQTDYIAIGRIHALTPVPISTCEITLLLKCSCVQAQENIAKCFFFLWLHLCFCLFHLGKH